MRTVYLITDEDSDIEKAAEAMADDYEVSREVMKAALEKYTIANIDIFMDTLREKADNDRWFDRLFVQPSQKQWKRVNPYGELQE